MVELMTAAVPLGELVDQITSGSRAWRSRLGSGSGRFLLSQCIRDGHLDLGGAPAVDAPADKEAERTRVQRGDILITIVGDVGRVALVREDPGEAYVSQSVALVRPGRGIDPRYLEAYLRSAVHGQAYFKEKQYGVGRGHLLLRHLKEVPVFVPTSALQRQIVERMDETLPKIEAATNALTRANARTLQYRRAVLARAFPQMINSSVDRPSVSAGWHRYSIGDVSVRVTKGTTPTSLGYEYVSSGVRFVKAESLVGGVVDHAKCAFIDGAADQALARSRLATGDVLFSIAGTLGRSAVVRETDLPANTNQAVAIIRLRDPSLATYVRYWLSTPYVQALVRRDRRGVGLFNLNLEQIRRLEVPFPESDAETDSIVEGLDRVLSDVDALKIEMERSAARVPALRDAVVGRLLGLARIDSGANQ